MRSIEAAFEMGTLCCEPEAAFEMCFGSKILDLRCNGSLTLDTPLPGNTTFMNHARDVVWLGI
jgi:hypothetical protein